MTDSLPTGSAKMTNEVVGFDIGAESIKCSVWTPGATSDILGSSTIIQNDASQYSSNVSVCIKKDGYSVCDHAKPSAKTNLTNYIWNIKSQIGDHHLIKDLEERKENYEYRKSLCLDGKRAYYKLKVNKQEVEVDAEAAMSLIFEYLYYINFKKEDSVYESVSVIAKEGYEQSPHVIVSIPSYYTKASIRGLQVALNAKSFGPASFVRDYVAACVDYGYHRNLVGDFDNESKTVLFVNMGHSYTSCTLARYEKNLITILDHAYTMLGGIDFTTVLFKEIKQTYIDHCQDVDFKSLSDMRKDKMNKQFWDMADKTKKEFSLDGIDITEIEIENLVSNEGDLFFNFELTLQRAMDLWKPLTERFDKFINEFVEMHREDTVNACEINGGGMRLPILKEITSSSVKMLSIQKLSNTLDMSDSVSRGLTVIGQEYYVDSGLTMNSETVTLEYSLGENKDVKETMSILGRGRKEPEENKLCISVECVDSLEEGEDHDWAAILNNFSSCSSLRPSVLEQFEAIGDSDSENEGADVIDLCESHPEAAPEKESVPGMKDDSASTDNQPSPMAPVASNTMESGPVDSVSMSDSFFRDTKRYSTMALDDAVELEISGVYSIRSSVINERSSIVNRQSNRVFGYAYTEAYQLNGDYCLYYDEAMKVKQEECHYMNDCKDGLYCRYYNNSKNSLHMKGEYKNGKRVNQFITYYESGQMECILSYEKGIEQRRIEFHETGYMKRFAERCDNGDHSVWKIIEFTKDGNILNYGFGKRVPSDHHYAYSFCGDGCLIGRNKYFMEGRLENGSIFVETANGSVEYSINECHQAIRTKNERENYVYKKKDFPWEKMKREESKDKLVTTMCRKNYKIVERMRDGKKEICITRHVFGYDLWKVEKTKGQTIRWDYYPLPGEGKTCDMGLFKVCFSMEGAYDSVRVARKRMFDKSNNCIHEECYLNTGEPL